MYVPSVSYNAPVVCLPPLRERVNQRIAYHTYTSSGFSKALFCGAACFGSMAEEYHKLTDEQKRMLFLNKAQRDVLKAEEERLAARHRFAEIVFVYFLVDWTLRDIKSVIMRIAMEHISAMYIGITESPCWRWRLCDGYKVPGTEDDDEE